MTGERLTKLFDLGAHNPSFATIRRAIGSDRAPIDFCVPVNRHFPSASLLDEIREALPDLVRYYPDYAEKHQRAIARIAVVPARNIVVANGSTELITLLCEQAIGPIATPVPTFGRWTDLPTARGMPVSFLQHERDDDFQLSVEQIVAHVRRHRIRTFVLCNPNSPTGAVLDARTIEQLVDELQDLDLIVIDESFLDFSGIDSAALLTLVRPNLVVVKSLGKSLGWHGIRAGYAVAGSARADRLRACMPWWNINGIAAFVLEHVAGCVDELQDSFSRVRMDRDDMANGLAAIERMRVLSSHANFLFAELDADLSGRNLRDRLLSRHGLMVRECGTKVGSSDRYLRLAVNLPEENERLIDALRVELGK